MQKFEYKIIGPSDVASMNVERQKRKEKPGGFTEVFNIYGAEGWEMCDKYDKYNFVFKRKISEGVV